MAGIPGLAQSLRFVQPCSLSSHPSSCPPSVFLPASKSLSSRLFRSSRSLSQGSVRVTVPRGAASASARSAATYEFAEDIGQILGEVSVFAATGESVMFKDLWDQNQGIAVVALLRHFGCPCCWELASNLKESKARFDSAGVKLIAVGVGSPDKARMLAERLPFPMECLYADPDRKAYDVLGLYYGFGRTFFNPASAKVFSRLDSLKQATKNYNIEATPDDRSGVLQQGGMFVFKGKQLLYARKDEGTGDHAPLDSIYNVCCKVPAA
ncbi:hypothetical protein Nepgr_008180 [Nepenthes gracilis]|uniref:Thioredoxin-like protein AAED1, chloroplastic n=1 Tax=Nepenthes gracilis TaxID=150966 RepID=A0AAD3S8K8_NEPGR|nr:hypothetical protein Nepgr_008180 [Nepenthes gracilis]